MDVHLPILVQDRITAARKGIKAFESFRSTSETILLDGPVSERVAILDFDQKGKLVDGARFHPPTASKKQGFYDVDGAAGTQSIASRSLNQVTVFAAILKTMQMFESKDALGRRLRWAFDAPQLLVVPRAGSWANAFYERDTHSLQFFYFENPHLAGDMVYTSLSLDIVAHETGHAILDGIVPSLYDSISPQSLALHEAIADLVAVLVSFYSRELVEAVLSQSKGSIQNSNAFSSLAEEFGEILDETGRVGYLRNLLNDTNLDPDDKANCVRHAEPHELSQVLSGALYKLMMKLHEDLKKEYRRNHSSQEDYSVSGKALAVARDRFRRMLLRALDYIPIGDASFADYGRAIIAADQASYPNHLKERRWIREEFVRRHIVHDQQALKVKTNFKHSALKDVSLDDLRDSDLIAYQFAEKNRKLLCIPPKASYEVEPRLDVTKTYTHTKEDVDTRELIFKVSWTQIEPNSLGNQFPASRRYKLGTTMAIDWETKKIRALLTSGQNISRKEAIEQGTDRDIFLTKLVKKGYLVPEREAIGPDGRKLQSVIGSLDINGAMKVVNMARMLHIIAGGKKWTD
jgi:hypothetical protein